MSKTLAEATEEVKAALAPLPDGYRISIVENYILVQNETLGFIISPLVIRDDLCHVAVAKEMFPKLIIASPVKGNA